MQLCRINGASKKLEELLHSLEDKSNSAFKWSRNDMTDKPDKLQAFILNKKESDTSYTLNIDQNID